MPTATLTVLSNNDLQISFSEDMIKVPLTELDISVRVYGPSDTYSFIWTAEYSDSKTVIIDTTFNTMLQGMRTELVVVELVKQDKFKSLNTQRKVDIENKLTGYLNEEGEQLHTKVAGQTTLLLFLISVGLSALSSFGGNSMEMMWGLLNTLQILYFISYIHVHFPTTLKDFFKYLRYANASNEYLSKFTYLIFPEEKFTQDEVNEKFGEKCFFLNSSDKIPVLAVCLLIFAFTFLFDKLNIKRSNKVLRILYKVVDYFKYNFFIRFGLEIFLELFLNALINLYFVSVCLLLTYL